MIKCNSFTFKITPNIDNIIEQLQAHTLGPETFSESGICDDKLWKCMDWQTGERLHFTYNSLHGLLW
jgi:hypothetical protein